MRFSPFQRRLGVETCRKRWSACIISRTPIASIWRTRFVPAGRMAEMKSSTAVTAVKPSVKRNTRGSSPKKGRRASALSRRSLEGREISARTSVQAVITSRSRLAQAKDRMQTQIARTLGPDKHLQGIIMTAEYGNCHILG